ncbi:MAG: hypothetical protein F4Y03_18265 [Alphaproteobacteria bacterium]|nr:hypothetical protein [Alphaproteobacteria bacterium]
MTNWMRFCHLAGAAADVIVGRHAGRTITIPTRVDEDHWLAQLLGGEVMRQVVFNLGGSRIYVPQAPARQARNRRIRELAREGFSSSALAERFGLSQRQVRGVLRG